eukprot:g1482.t1
MDAAIEFAECLQAKVAEDPPCSLQQFEEAVEQLSGIALAQNSAIADEVKEALKAARNDAAVTLHQRSAAWCERIMGECLLSFQSSFLARRAGVDQALDGGQENGTGNGIEIDAEEGETKENSNGKQFSQQLNAFIAEYRARAAGPAVDAVLLRAFVGCEEADEETGRRLGIEGASEGESEARSLGVGRASGAGIFAAYRAFDEHELRPRRDGAIREAIASGQAALEAKYAAEGAKLEQRGQSERQVLERLQRVAVDRSENKPASRELDVSQAQLAELDQQLQELEEKRGRLQASADAGRRAAKEYNARAAEARCRLREAKVAESDAAASRDAALRALGQEQATREQERARLAGGVADAHAVSRAALEKLEAKLLAAREERAETQQRLAALTLKLSALPSGFQQSFFEQQALLAQQQIK